MRGKELELLMILYGDTIGVSGIFTKRAQNWRRNFCLTQSPPPAFLSLQMLMQRRSRTKTTKARNHSFVFFHLFFPKLRSPFSRSLSVHEPMSIHRSLAKAAVWKQTVMLIPARFDLWECELGLRTVRLSSVLTNKRRDKSTLSIVVTPVHGASPTARMIAGIGEDAPPRWHNAPQASIYAWEEIRSASPVVSTSIHNIHQWSANIILLMIQPLLKYGLQNRLTYCTCLCTSCQAFLARCKRDVACLPALGGGG